MKRKGYDSSMRQFTSVLSSTSSSSSSESTNVDSDNTNNNMNKDEIEKIDRIKKEIYDWITKVVIGLNLCPFASKPVMSTSENKFSIHVVTASGSNDELEYESEITQQVVQEMCRLLMSTKGTTSVVVLPDYKVEDFTAFLDFVGFLQDVFLEGEDLQKVYPEYSFVLSSKLPDLDGNKKEAEEKSKRDQTFYDDISTVVELLSGNIQLVAFHPEFRFAESNESDIENYTNRSPYPMIHILREADVYYASENILKGDSEKVWGRNIKLLQKMDETLGYEEAVNYCSARTQIGKDDETVQEQIKKILKDIGGVKDSS